MREKDKKEKEAAELKKKRKKESELKGKRSLRERKRNGRRNKMGEPPR